MSIVRRRRGQSRSVVVALLAFLPLILSHAVSSAFKPGSTKTNPSRSCTSRRMSTSSSENNMNANTSENFLFGRFQIPESHIFYRSKLSTAFVNLRPIVPGHVLVVSNRVVPLLEDLTDEEYSDLWSTVRKLQPMLRELYHTDDDREFGFNIAVQNGRASGQTVPHVHVHILPRIGGDIERNDDIYQALEEWAPRDSLKPETAESSNQLEVPDDDDRRDRTSDEMAEEAGRYRKQLEKGQ